MPEKRDGRIAYSTKGEEVLVKKSLNNIGKLNQTVANMMNQIKAFPLTRGANQEDELQKFRGQIDKVIDRETDRIVSASSGANGHDIAMFLNTTFANASKRTYNGYDVRGLLQNKSLEELMNDNGGQLDIILSNRYKNINSLYDDINLITNQIAEMNEVIDTFRDSIVNSDNIVNTVSRIVEFVSSDSETPTGMSLLEVVYKMEKDTDITGKLKKIIVPNTLKYGNFYVFTQPYKDLFAKFKAMDDRYKLKGGITNPSIFGRESFTPTTEDLTEIKSVYEEFKTEFDYSADVRKLSAHSKDRITEESFNTLMETYMGNISIVDDPCVPLMEDAEISALSAPDMRNSIVKAVKMKKSNKSWSPIKSSNGGPAKYSDGVLNMAGANLKEVEDEYSKEYADIGGVFVKLYDPKRCIPVYVMDYCIGYYILYETESTQNGTSNILNTVHSLSRSTMLFRDDKKREFENRFVGLIADRICRSIDKKFLKQNANFKELIANAIAHDNFYQKAFRIQFVSSNYMTHFKINEDYNTHLGVSVLYRSMFYAMLYLLMLLYTILIKVTRGSDLRMFLIKGNGTNKDVSGKINKIVSDFKQKQISYNDFGSVRGILSKVGQGKDIGIPVGMNGERTFDIEQLSGVQVDMDSDLMQLLRKAMISTTGCPSAMVNYLEEVDFAKQIQMIHSKFVVRSITYQEETEKSITELYQKLLSYGDYNIDDKDIEKLSFKWSRPKMLNSQNMGDLISTSDQLAEFLVKVYEGDNSVNDPRVKDRIFSYVIKELLMPGVFDWNKLGGDIEGLILKLRSEIQEEESTKIQANDNE